MADEPEEIVDAAVVATNAPAADDEKGSDLPPLPTLSKEVIAFAYLMQIHMNDEPMVYIGTPWRGMSPQILVNKLRDHTANLRNGIQSKNFRSVEEYAAKAAIEAMCIFDGIIFYRQELERDGWRNGFLQDHVKKAEPVEEPDDELEAMKRRFNKAPDQLPG